ncbi:MAG: hypothetical protein Q8K70_09785 [Bacteroidota bacterium]|nr:hypothetical protein [Bacteroidota bacterium]
MKKSIILISITLWIFNTYAQNNSFGKTLNIGLGTGFYGYSGYTSPVFNINYEFDVAKNFTLAPSVSFYTFSKFYSPGKQLAFVRYRQTIVPIGVKGTYYLDEALNLNNKWDVYLAGTLGFNVISTRWDNGINYSDKIYRDNIFRYRSPLFLDIHFGAEYHLNPKTGLYIDLSSSFSTFGLSLKI